MAHPLEDSIMPVRLQMIAEHGLDGVRAVWKVLLN